MLIFNCYMPPLATVCFKAILSPTRKSDTDQASLALLKVLPFRSCIPSRGSTGLPLPYPFFACRMTPPNSRVHYALSTIGCGDQRGARKRLWASQVGDCPLSFRFVIPVYCHTSKYSLSIRFTLTPTVAHLICPTLHLFQPTQDGVARSKKAHGSCKMRRYERGRGVFVEGGGDSRARQGGGSADSTIGRKGQGAELSPTAKGQTGNSQGFRYLQADFSHRVASFMTSGLNASTERIHVLLSMSNRLVLTSHDAGLHSLPWKCFSFQARYSHGIFRL